MWIILRMILVFVGWKVEVGPSQYESESPRAKRSADELSKSQADKKVPAPKLTKVGNSITPNPLQASLGTSSSSSSSSSDSVCSRSALIFDDPSLLLVRSPGIPRNLPVVWTRRIGRAVARTRLSRMGRVSSARESWSVSDAQSSSTLPQPGRKNPQRVLPRNCPRWRNLKRR